MIETQPTREAWLNQVAARLAPMFVAVDAPLPARLRIAMAFTSTGTRGRAVGECWDKAASADDTFEILIRPDIADPHEVAAILAHELVHAAVGIRARHGPKFRRVALAIGLQGRMTSTTAGPRLTAALEPILAAVGPLPHASLNFFGRVIVSGSPSGLGDLTTRPRPQSARMIKCQCGDCGYIARTARRWIEAKGAPHCPQHGAMRAVDRVNA